MTGSSNYVYAKLPPKAGLDYPYKELFNQALYRVRADADTDGATFTFASTASANSTTAVLPLWHIPANTIIIGIGWKCIDSFTDGTLNIPAYISVRTVEDTGTTESIIAEFTMAELCSTGQTGLKAIWFESTADAKVYGVCDSGGAGTTGKFALWLIYGANLNQTKWV